MCSIACCDGAVPSAKAYRRPAARPAAIRIGFPVAQSTPPSLEAGGFYLMHYFPSSRGRTCVRPGRLLASLKSFIPTISLPNGL